MVCKTTIPQFKSGWHLQDTVAAMCAVQAYAAHLGRHRHDHRRRHVPLGEDHMILSQPVGTALGFMSMGCDRWRQVVDRKIRSTFHVPPVELDW